MRLILATGLALLAFTAPASASTLPPREQAHYAIHQVFDNLDGSLGNHRTLRIGRCRPRGVWLVCPVGLGPRAHRLRFATRMTWDGEQITFASVLL